MQPCRHPAHPKQASRFEGFPTRAHVLCLPVTHAAESPMTSLAPRTRAIYRASRGTRNASGRLLRALCEQNARRRPQGALHTRSPGKPVRSKFAISSLTSVRPRGRLVSTAGVSGPDFTRVGAPVAASCEAQHRPRARYCANPARSSKQLRPLHGPCPSSNAVSVAIQRTHSRVP